MTRPRSVWRILCCCEERWYPHAPLSLSDKGWEGSASWGETSVLRAVSKGNNSSSQSVMRSVVSNASSHTSHWGPTRQQQGRPPGQTTGTTFKTPSFTYLLSSDFGCDSLLLRSLEQIRVHDQIADTSIELNPQLEAPRKINEVRDQTCKWNVYGLYTEILRFKRGDVIRMAQVSTDHTCTVQCASVKCEEL